MEISCAVAMWLGDMICGLIVTKLSRDLHATVISVAQHELSPVES